jgi:probable phosphoglycerate mutase
MNGRKSEELRVIYLARHGETAWSRTGQHTGLTDLPLTEQGGRNARRLGEWLKGLTFAKIFISLSQPVIRLWNETHYLLASNDSESMEELQ